MRRRATRVLLLAACWLGASATPAQPARTHDITVDDYFSLGVVADVATSPSGSHVAYSEGRWQQTTDDRKADLWLVVPKTQ